MCISKLAFYEQEWAQDNLFIVSSDIEHMQWFWLLGVINKAYLSISSFVWVYVFISLGYLLEKWMDGSYKKHAFNFVEKVQAIN